MIAFLWVSFGLMIYSLLLNVTGFRTAKDINEFLARIIAAFLNVAMLIWIIILLNQQ